MRVHNLLAVVISAFFTTAALADACYPPDPPCPIDMDPPAYVQPEPHDWAAGTTNLYDCYQMFGAYMDNNVPNGSYCRSGQTYTAWCFWGDQWTYLLFCD